MVCLKLVLDSLKQEQSLHCLRKETQNQGSSGYPRIGQLSTGNFFLIFKLFSNLALRYGFNGQGHDEVLKRVDQFWKNRKIDEKILGVNIGKNKLQQDALSDYLAGLKLFANKCDYITINISSPNTPGLRSLQNRKELENLIDPVEFYHLVIFSIINQKIL